MTTPITFTTDIEDKGALAFLRQFSAALVSFSQQNEASFAKAAQASTAQNALALQQLDAVRAAETQKVNAIEATARAQVQAAQFALASMRQDEAEQLASIRRVAEARIAAATAVTAEQRAAGIEAAQTGAQLLKALEFTARPVANATNAEGQGLITVDAKDVENSQRALNNAKLQAVAITKEQVAATKAAAVESTKANAAIIAEQDAIVRAAEAASAAQIASVQEIGFAIEREATANVAVAKQEADARIAEAVRAVDVIIATNERIVASATASGELAVEVAREQGAARIAAAESGIATLNAFLEKQALAELDALAVQAESPAIASARDRLALAERELEIERQIGAEEIKNAEIALTAAREALAVRADSVRSVAPNVAASLGINSDAQAGVVTANEAALASTRALAAEREAVSLAWVTEERAEVAAVVEGEKEKTAAVVAAIDERLGLLRAGNEASIESIRQETAANVAALESQTEAERNLAIVAIESAKERAAAGLAAGVAATESLNAEYDAAVARIAALRAESEAEAAAAVAVTEGEIAAGRAAAAKQALAASNLAAALAADKLASSETRVAAAETEASTAASRQAGSLRGLSGGYTQLFELLAAFEAAHLFNEFIRAGTQFNQTIETATLAIASLITAEAELRDAQGHLVQGLPALNVALALSADQVDKLRIAGLQTAATTEQLVKAYQQAVAAGLSAGLTLDQIRQTTVQIVQAATAIGVPLDKLSFQIRSILQGTIDRNSRVARVLLITNEEIRQAKEQGNLFEFLQQKLQAFTVAGGVAAQTMAVLKSNLINAFQVFAGTTTKPLFEDLRVEGLKALADIFDLKNSKISDSLSGIVTTLQESFAGLGDFLVQSIEKALTGLREFSQFLDKNHDEVLLITKAFFDMEKQFGGLILDIGRMITDTIRWGTETGVIRDIFDHISQTVRFTRALIQYLNSSDILPTGDAKKTIEDILSGADDVRVAQERLTTTITDQNTTYGQSTAKIIGLTREYERLQHSLEGANLSAQKRTQLDARQKEIMAELIPLGISSANLTDRMRDASISLAQALGEEVAARVRQIQYIEAANEADATSSVNDRQKLIDQSKDISDAARLLLTANPLAKLTANDAPAAFIQQLDEANRRVAGTRTELERTKQLVKDVNNALIPTNDVSIKGLPSDATAKAGAQLADARKQLEAALKDARAAFTSADADLQTQMKDHQISIQQYFSTLATITTQEFQKEIDAQKKFVDAAVKFGKPGDIAEAQAGLVALNAAESKAREENVRAELKARRDLSKQVEDIHIQFLEATGNQTDADLLKLQVKWGETIAQLKIEAQKGGQGAADAAAALIDISKIIDIEKVAIKMNQVRQIIRDGEDQMNEDVAAIRAKQEVGLITESAANQQVLAEYTARKEALQGLLSYYTAIRDAVVAAKGDTTAADKSIGLVNEQLNHLAPALLKADLATHQLRETIKSSGLSILENFFSSGIASAKSFGDAMHSLAVSVIQSIQQIIAHLIALKIMETILGLAGGNSLDTSGINPSVIIPTPSVPGPLGNFAKGGSVADAVAQQRALGGARRFASGGFHGPVIGPSMPLDQIPIWVTGGEYVLNPRATAKLGKDWLDQANFGHRMPDPVQRRGGRFAGGGPVASLVQETQRIQGAFAGEISLAPDLIYRHLATPAGHKVVVNIIRANAKSIRGIVSA